MFPEPGTPSLASRLAVSSEDADAAGALVAAVAAQVSLTTAVHVLSAGLSGLVKSPLAVLSRNGKAWQFEAKGFPDGAQRPATLAWMATSVAGSDPAQQQVQQSGVPWTAIELGRAGGREWLVLGAGHVVVLGRGAWSR